MMTLIHHLRRYLGERESSREAAAGGPSADRFFTSRLASGGQARLLPPEGVGGYVGPEPRIEIPFRLDAGDGEVKVVVFSDPPGLLSLAIEQPDGTLLAAADAGSGAEWTQEGATTTCSFALPEACGGTWRAVLTVDTWRFKAYLLSIRVRFPREFERLAAHGVFYSVSALAARRPLPSPRDAQRPRRPSPSPRRSPWAAVHPAL